MSKNIQKFRVYIPDERLFIPEEKENDSVRVGDRRENKILKQHHL